MDIEFPQAVEQAYCWPLTVAAKHSSEPIALGTLQENTLRFSEKLYPNRVR